MTKTIFLLFLLGLCLHPAAFGEDNTASFGTTQRSEGALIGILYDFKQNQKREPVPNMHPGRFLELVGQFIDSNWDEGLENQSYRVSRPLYTTELVIDRMNADVAPKAFGVEKNVKPRMWMAHYKGQVAPPEDGTYRFVGYADDFVAVAVNSKTVLVACLRSSVIPCKWQPQEKSGLWGMRGECVAGDWMELKKGQPIDVDIITGEVPGGIYLCFLGIQKRGEQLQPEHGQLLKPHPFQLSKSPSSLPNTLPWKGIQ